MTAILIAAALLLVAVAVSVLIAVWIGADGRPVRPHPHAADGLDTLRTRRPQDDLEGWR